MTLDSKNEVTTIIHYMGAYAKRAAGVLIEKGAIAPSAWSGFQMNETETIISGTDVSELLLGTSVAETLLGLGGNDKLEGGFGADILDGGEGIDTARYVNATTGVTVDLVTGGSGGEADGDVYISIERVGGSAFSDLLTGDGNNNILLGGGGDDTLNGAGGSDHLRGGADDDVLNGGDGRDFLDGGRGGDILNGGNGIDTADYRKSDASVTIDMIAPINNAGEATGDTFIDIERVVLSDNGDSFIGSQLDNQADFVRGGAGSDTLFGNAGDDRLYGDTGSDVLNGGDGIDRLYGGAGSDQLTGGADRDAFFFGAGAGADVITDWTNGVDRILFFSDSGVSDFEDISVIQSSADVLLIYGGSNFLFLRDTLVSEIDASDFGFIS